MEKDNITQQAQTVNDGFDKVEDLRMEGYDVALSLNATKEATQTRERERLVQKYGENHPRVAKVDRALTQAPRLTKAVRAQHTRTQGAAPATKPDTWQVHGQISDARGNGKGEFTVSLFNKDRKWEKDLGYDCSDPNGIFTLVVSDAALIAKYKGVPLYLTVSDDTMRVVYRDTNPMYIVAGDEVTRRVVIDDSGCLPPEKDGEVGETLPTTNPPKDKGYVVWGHVKNSRGLPMVGVTVFAYASTPDGDCDLGKRTTTDQSGRYKVNYTAADFGAEEGTDARADIIVTVNDQSGKRIHETEVTQHAAQVARIDMCIRKKWFSF